MPLVIEILRTDLVTRYAETLVFMSTGHHAQLAWYVIGRRSSVRSMTVIGYFSFTNSPSLAINTQVLFMGRTRCGDRNWLVGCRSNILRTLVTIHDHVLTSNMPSNGHSHRHQLIDNSFWQFLLTSIFSSVFEATFYIEILTSEALVEEGNALSETRGAALW